MIQIFTLWSLLLLLLQKYTLTWLHSNSKLILHSSFFKCCYQDYEHLTGFVFYLSNLIRLIPSFLILKINAPMIYDSKHPHLLNPVSCLNHVIFWFVVGMKLSLQQQPASLFQMMMMMHLSRELSLPEGLSTFSAAFFFLSLHFNVMSS